MWLNHILLKLNHISFYFYKKYKSTDYNEKINITGFSLWERLIEHHVLHDHCASVKPAYTAAQFSGSCRCTKPTK
jgi:hypothetical protein